MESNEEYNISSFLSNKKEFTEKDMQILLILLKKGRITNPELLKELKSLGTKLGGPNSVAHYKNKLEKQTSATKLKIEKLSIIKVARFGLTPILLKILATDLTNGLKILRSLNFDAITLIIPLFYRKF